MVRLEGCTAVQVKPGHWPEGQRWGGAVSPTVIELLPNETKTLKESTVTAATRLWKDFEQTKDFRDADGLEPPAPLVTGLPCELTLPPDAALSAATVGYLTGELKSAAKACRAARQAGATLDFAEVTFRLVYEVVVEELGEDDQAVELLARHAHLPADQGRRAVAHLPAVVYRSLGSTPCLPGVPKPVERGRARQVRPTPGSVRCLGSRSPCEPAAPGDQLEVREAPPQTDTRRQSLCCVTGPAPGEPAHLGAFSRRLPLSRLPVP